MNKTLFTIGLLLVCLAAALLLMNAIPFGFAAAIAVLGIGLVAVAGRSGRPQPKSRAEAQVVQTIFSPDQKLRAVIKQRPDGKFQVETWKFVDYLQDSSPNWARQGNWGITDFLSDAVDMAESYIQMGAGDF